MQGTIVMFDPATREGILTRDTDREQIVHRVVVFVTIQAVSGNTARVGLHVLVRVRELGLQPIGNGSYLRGIWPLHSLRGHFAGLELFNDVLPLLASFEYIVCAVVRAKIQAAAGELLVVAAGTVSGNKWLNGLFEGIGPRRRERVRDRQ